MRMGDGGGDGIEACDRKINGDGFLLQVLMPGVVLSVKGKR